MHVCTYWFWKQGYANNMCVILTCFKVHHKQCTSVKIEVQLSTYNKVTVVRSNTLTHFWPRLS